MSFADINWACFGLLYLILEALSLFRQGKRR
jgi:hypothetical protein